MSAKSTSKNSKTILKQPPKRLSERNLALLSRGIAKLVGAEKQFAEQFGMQLSQPLYKYPESEFNKIIMEWLREGKTGEEKIQQLIDSLYQHQLALINALDGVALRSIEYAYQQIDSYRLKERIALWLQKDNKRKQLIADFKKDEQVRYQHIIAPGLVDYYLLAREKLKKEKA